MGVHLTRRTSQRENMKCQICQTPMENGFLCDNHWCRYSPVEYRLEHTVLRAIYWLSGRQIAHPLQTHRCPKCSRLELTAP
jgi:hypothetical protein